MPDQPHDTRRFFILRWRQSLTFLVVTGAVIVGIGAALSLPHPRRQVEVPGTEADFRSLMQLISTEILAGNPTGDGQRPNANMIAISVSTLGIAAVALAIWLMVRKINRGRAWTAQFWAVGTLAILLAYPFSFGPACWMESRQSGPSRMIALSSIYFPVIWVANRSARIGDVATWYSEVGAAEGWNVSFDGDQLSWWVRGPTCGYRTVISCCYSAGADEWTCETAIVETEDGTDEVD